MSEAENVMSPSDDASNHLDVPPPPPRSPPPPPSSPPHTNATQQAYPTFHQPSLGSQISSSAVQYTSQQYGLAPDEGYNNDQNTWQGYAESSGHGGYENSGDYGYYAGCFTDSGPITAPAPPAKRQRLDDDSIAIALNKIKSYVGNPKKFLKAAPLLRQLFTEGKLSGAHGDLAFECLKAAMADVSFQTSQQLALRKEYVKLFTVASKYAQIFSAREKAQLDVYGLLAVLRNQLQTDDSFVLNKILARLKESILHLPKTTSEDDSTLAHLQDLQQEQGTLHPLPKSNSQESATETAEEGFTWSDEEILCMKREALLLCLEAAKPLHSKLWGRTSIEIAFEEAQKSRDKFCERQRSRIDDLALFARSQRTARQQGRSQAAANRRDKTSFEAARAEWSKASGISGRGKVGAQGDHGTEVWLG